MPKEKRGHHRSLGYNTVIFVDPSFDAVCTFTQPDKNDCQFLPAVIYFQYNSTKVYRSVCYLMFYSNTKQLKRDGKPTFKQIMIPTIMYWSLCVSPIMGQDIKHATNLLSVSCKCRGKPSSLMEPNGRQKKVQYILHIQIIISLFNFQSLKQFDYDCW